MFRFFLLVFVFACLAVTIEAQFRGYGTYGPAWRRRLWQEQVPFAGEHEIRTRLARF